MKRLTSWYTMNFVLDEKIYEWYDSKEKTASWLDNGTVG
jgi:hypothetical protein